MLARTPPALSTLASFALLAGIAGLTAACAGTPTARALEDVAIVGRLSGAQAQCINERPWQHLNKNGPETAERRDRVVVGELFECLHQIFGKDDDTPPAGECAALVREFREKRELYED